MLLTVAELPEYLRAAAFHSATMPLYLLTVFAKNERANLSQAERNALAGLVGLLVQIWFER
jgi:hypothetical protein